MTKLYFQEVQPYLFIIVGLVFVLVALFRKASNLHLKQTGLKAEGIIFELEKEPCYNSSMTGSSNILDKVTIRFVTQKQEWITSEIKQEFAVFYTGQYKKGDSVIVYYNPKNPSQFFVDTKQSGTLSRVIFAVVGLGFSLFGLYKLLHK